MLNKKWGYTFADNVIVDTWQSKFDMIPLDVEIIEVKNSRKIKVYVEGSLYKVFPSIQSFEHDIAKCKGEFG
tara:strand:+ start:728 stop:943 length:216 start_codon:yes stop_codon:yes gene_type:complete